MAIYIFFLHRGKESRFPLFVCLFLPPRPQALRVFLPYALFPVYEKHEANLIGLSPVTKIIYQFPIAFQKSTKLLVLFFASPFEAFPAPTPA